VAPKNQLRAKKAAVPIGSACAAGRRSGACRGDARNGSPAYCPSPFWDCRVNQHVADDGAVVFAQACKLGCEGIVSKRLGSLYRSGRSRQWIKVKNPAAPAVRRETEEDWGR